MQLEEEPDLSLLGFLLCPVARSASYIVPMNAWQCKHPHSAGSVHFLHSGIQSRASLIFKYTYPATEIPKALEQLDRFYVDHGYCLDQVVSLTSKTFKRVAHVLKNKQSFLPARHLGLYGLLCVSTPVTKV